LAFALLLAVGCSRTSAPGEEAFVGDRSLTLWTRLAEVKEPVATLHYGERIEIVARRNDQVQVRTTSGAVGWTEQRYLLSGDLWHRATALRDRARSLSPQARAATDKPTNLRVEPGRSGPRIYQFRSGVALDILERTSAEVPSSGEEGSGQAAEARDEAKPRHEDWVLVRGDDESAGPIAGWILRRFLRYKIPPELLDYSNQYRFVAWFPLNRVPLGTPIAPVRRAGAGAPPLKNAPGPPPGAAPENGEDQQPPGEKPQFLVAGIQGPEGQECDFTLIRAYTWGAARQRYETAFVESNLCGALPIRVQAASALGGDARFAFTNEGRAGKENREYVFRKTVVRRVDNRPARARGGRAAH
jgi:hypothetical protein